MKDLNDLCRMEPGELERLRPMVSYQYSNNRVRCHSKDGIAQPSAKKKEAQRSRHKISRLPACLGF